MVTEAYLDMRLEDFKKDITEGYLDTRLDGFKKGIDTRLDGFKKGIDVRLDEFKQGITEEMRGETVKILQAVDGVMARFDVAEKEEAAHSALHGRITNDIHEHDQRIKKLEVFTHI